MSGGVLLQGKLRLTEEHSKMLIRIGTQLFPSFSKELRTFLKLTVWVHGSIVCSGASEYSYYSYYLSI